jgi:ABC-type transport system involved in cytochrome bd biosynthesis fused ATPase/permease subunit
VVLPVVLVLDVVVVVGVVVAVVVGVVVGLVVGAACWVTVVVVPPPHADTVTATETTSGNATARYLTDFTELPPGRRLVDPILSDQPCPGGTKPGRRA